jgi:uncharacterized protein with FMN-binding domain
MSRHRGRGVALFAGVTALVGLVFAGRYATLSTAQAPAAHSGAQGAAQTPAPSASSSSSPSPAGSASPAAADRTVDGPVSQTPYGPVQVAVTLAGSRITAVKELQSPDDRGRSIAINEYAAPILQQEVIRSQSAKVDTVSGATYTSAGYLQSLQAALDKAR